MIVHILFFILAINTISLGAFDNLSEVQEYAQRLTENQPLENKNILYPRFTQYNAQMAPSFLSRSLMRLGLYNPVWSPYALEQAVLLGIDHLKKNKGATRKLSVFKNAECIIVGPLFGAFHSLVRILSELQRLSYLDENLLLKKKNTYLIFNGDAIDRSPHTLETLTLILNLLNKNPEQVVYIRGQNEHQQFGLDRGLKYQLEERAEFLPTLKSLLVKLFDLLPLQVDIKQGKENKVIRVRNFHNEKMVYDKDLQGLITAENRVISYAFHPGLILQEPLFNTTVWSVFSSPLELYQKHFDFTYDAFAALTIADPIARSTIALYNQVASSKEPFKRSAVYSIITAQELTSQIDTRVELTPADTITLGSTMDLSRVNKGRGFAARAGLSAAVNRINREGGVHNKLVRIFIADDEYSGTLARAAIENFINDVGPVIISPLGSPTLAASLDLIKEKKIYVLFPFSGSNLFRDQSFTNIINFRASYESEAEALVYYANRKLLGKDFALFYQDDTYGETALKGAEQMLKKLGIPKWLNVSYQTNTVQVDKAVEKIKAANPDVIALFSLPPATIELIKRLGVEFLSGKKLLALSPLGNNAFKLFLDSIGIKVTIAQAVPNPQQSNLPLVKEYREEIVKLGRPPDTYSLEGYIAASLVSDILKKIPGPITMDSVKEVIENIKNYNFKGLTLNYNPANRQLSNDLWIETTTGEWVKQNIDDLKAFHGVKGAQKEEKLPELPVDSRSKGTSPLLS